MPFISFIYKIKNESTTYYGKCFMEYISDDHTGLDNEVKKYLCTGLNNYRTMYNLPILEYSDLSVGVISYSINYNFNIRSSENEINCFDFYYDEQSGTYFVNGNTYTI